MPEGSRRPVVAVVGVGLIGGSIGLAADAEVRGWDPGDGVLAAALERGAVTVAAGSLPEAVAGADIVFVAVPVGALPRAVSEVLTVAGEDCVVTDVGSTKRSVVAAVDDPRFVGGHPLAGAETAGVEHARADLFQGATWYLTPTGRTGGMLYERLYRFLVELGGNFSGDLPMERVVDAAHMAGGVCVIAHPGRGDSVGLVTEADLNRFLPEIPVDGLEAHYRSHSDTVTALYRRIAADKGLLIAAGSDSHAPATPVDPMPWQAIWCRALLERLGIEVEPLPPGEPIWQEGMSPVAQVPAPQESKGATTDDKA